MSVLVNSAMCLHAQAGDLKFLNPVRKRMRKLLGESFLSLSFGDQNSVADARLALKRTAGCFLVVFAHGGSDYIRGGEYVHRLTRELIEGEKLLTHGDVALFRDKVVFCLSCDSNGLAPPSLRAGALGFVGFDSIPFNRYDRDGNPVSTREFEQHAQRIMAFAVNAAIQRFLTGRARLGEAVDFLRLLICRAAVDFVRRNSALKDRREIAALLLRAKSGMRYHGDPDVQFSVRR